MITVIIIIIIIPLSITTITAIENLWKLTNSTAVAGNMWAQSWENIFDIVKPFPNATGVDVTTALNDQVSYRPLPGVVSIL